MLDSNKKFVHLHIHPSYVEQAKKLPKGLSHSYLLLLPFVHQRRFGVSKTGIKRMNDLQIEEKLCLAFRTFPIGHHFYLVCQLAQNLGYTVEFPSINESEYLPIVQDKKVLLGFVGVPHLSESRVAAWIRERKKGLFTSLDDFYKRNPVSRTVLKSLVSSNTFRHLHRSTTALEWMLETYTSIIPSEKEMDTSWAHKKINYLTLLHEYWLKSITNLPSHYQVATEFPHLQEEEVAVLGRLISCIRLQVGVDKWIKWGIFTDEEKTLFLGQINCQTVPKWKIGEGYFLTGKVKGFQTQTWIQVQSARYLT